VDEKVERCSAKVRHENASSCEAATFSQPDRTAVTLKWRSTACATSWDSLFLSTHHIDRSRNPKLHYLPSTIDQSIDHRPPTNDHRPSTIDHRPSTTENSRNLESCEFSGGLSRASGPFAFRAKLWCEWNRFSDLIRGDWIIFLNPLHLHIRLGKSAYNDFGLWGMKTGKLNSPMGI
jgi:hypothetical protein